MNEKKVFAVNPKIFCNNIIDVVIKRKFEKDKFVVVGTSISLKGAGVPAEISSVVDDDEFAVKICAGYKPQELKNPDATVICIVSRQLARDNGLKEVGEL